MPDTLFWAHLILSDCIISCTPAIYIMLLTNVTSINLIKNFSQSLLAFCFIIPILSEGKQPIGGHTVSQWKRPGLRPRLSDPQADSLSVGWVCDWGGSGSAEMG